MILVLGVLYISALPGHCLCGSGGDPNRHVEKSLGR